MGQGGTAVAGALGVGRSRGAAHARPRPDCDLASPHPALRREQIKLQAALITPLMHVKGYAAPETKAAAERARLLIEQAEALGEPPEDPLLLFSVLYSFWVASFVAFDGDAIVSWRRSSWLSRRSKEATVPLMIGHRLMGTSLLFTGDIAEGRAHYDSSDRTLRSCRASSAGGAIWPRRRGGNFVFRALALWMLGYPEAALADADQALKDAREIGQAATLMYALLHVSVPYIHCGNYEIATRCSR